MFKARPPLASYEAKRIALLKPSALGDIVHSLPVLAALRQRYPAATITWVINRAYEPLIHGHPDLNDTICFDRNVGSRGWLAALAYYASFGKKLRRRRFDLVVDLQGLLRTGLMALATGAARRVGLSDAREGAAYCYTDVVPLTAPNQQLHAVDRYWHVATALGVGQHVKRFQLPSNAEADCWVAAKLANLPRPLLALAVGSRWQTKQWLPAHFAALIRRAHRHSGGSVVFVGGGNDATLAAQVAGDFPGGSLDLCGQTSLPQLTAVLRACDIVVANDTGPLHLATALGRPVVAPYTCTRVRTTGPYAVSGAVETQVWCAGSGIRHCSRMECMHELTADRLWPTLAEVLATWQKLQRTRSA